VPTVTKVVLSAEERATKIERLQDLQMKDDAGSLSNIVADLTSPDKEIREAAIEATKQFGSADAIPSLKAAAASAEDIEDQIDYLEAADFLSLPPMVVTPITPEQAAQLQAQAAARQQAQMPQNGPGQNPQAPAQ
jgi:HEAT repeat protein